VEYTHIFYSYILRYETQKKIITINGEKSEVEEEIPLGIYGKGHPECIHVRLAVMFE